MIRVERDGNEVVRLAGAMVPAEVTEVAEDLEHLPPSPEVRAA
ncbi:hypothetical protein [Nonomuraea sp. NPDC050786]